MNDEVTYSPQERFWLWALAAVGFTMVNGAFFYGLFQPGLMAETMANPLALAFMGEALLLMCAFAYLLGKWGVSRLSWSWFVALSMLGSMAFAIPVVLLWRRRDSASGRAG